MNATCGWGQGNEEHPCPKHYSRESCEPSENLMNDCQAARTDRGVMTSAVIVSYFNLLLCVDRLSFTCGGVQRMMYSCFQVVDSVTLDISV